MIITKTQIIKDKILYILSLDSKYILSLLPVLVIARLVTDIHKIPNNDYWRHFFMQILKERDAYDMLITLFISRSHEHLIISSNFLLLINYLITKGSNQGLFVICILINFIVLLILSLLYKNSLIFGRKYLWLAVLFTSVMFFLPNMAHNWIRSMSGVSWFLANGLFIATLVYSYYYIVKKSGRFYILILLSVLSFSAYSTGLATPLVISFFLLINWSYTKKSKSVLLSYIFFAAIAYILWVGLWYQKPLDHPDLNFSIINTSDYILSYLGNGFAKDHLYSRIYGFVGLFIGFMASIYTLTVILNEKRYGDINYKIKVTFIYSIFIYSTINIIMASIARFQDVELILSMQNRYVNIVNLYWYSLVLFIFMIIVNTVKIEKIKSIYVNIYLIIVFVVIITPGFWYGLIDTQTLINDFKSKEQQFRLMMQLEIYDPDPYLTFVNLSSRGLFDQIISLPNRHNHYPFSDPIVKDIKIGDKIADLEYNSEDGSEVHFGLDDFINISDKTDKSSDQYKNNGWICMENAKIRDLLFVNEDMYIVGAGIIDKSRKDIESLYGSNCLNSGFVGYIKDLDEGNKVTLYARDVDLKLYKYGEIYIPTN